jgi:cysteine-rich repeat protein
MRTRFLLPVLLSGSTVALTACSDDAPVVPPDGSSTGSSTGLEPTDGPEPTGVVDSTSTGDTPTTGDSTTSEDPDSTGPASGCGDGLITDEEACDDSNTEDGDGCTSTCTIEEGWMCNDQPSACFVVCGDAILAGDEQCDDDNVVDGDGCTAECQQEDGWACEGLPSDCVTVCGDGFVVGDDCDDGNNMDGDGCTADCLLEVGFFCDGEPSDCQAICGDGFVLGGEQCDDDDLDPDDGCDAACMVELGWSCMGQPSACMTGCGDGIVVGSEQCDDLDIEDGDGCSAMCTLEPGWICMDEPTTCVTECGDGLIAGAEQCDDDGLVDGDGCNSRVPDRGRLGVRGGAQHVRHRLRRRGDGGCRGVRRRQHRPGRRLRHRVRGWLWVELRGLAQRVHRDRPARHRGAGRVRRVRAHEPRRGGLLWQQPAERGGQRHRHHRRGRARLHARRCDRGGGGRGAPLRDPGRRQRVVLGRQRQSGHGTAGRGRRGPGAAHRGDRGAGGGGHRGRRRPRVCHRHARRRVVLGRQRQPAAGHGRREHHRQRHVPTAVVLPGGLGAIDLGLGEDHSCAVLEDNTVACWGDDISGQLGDGASGADNGVATLVPGLAVINDVEGGEDATCALDDLGQVRCWGDNIDGALGIGSTVDNPNPQLVALPSAAQAIALGDQFACALLATDDVYCWGEASDFQLASGDLVPQLVPGAAIGVPAVDLVDIVAGGRGACVVSATNQRWCWGYSEEGQLGIAPFFQLEPDPVLFSGPVSAVALDAPQYRGVICGVLLDGTVECAGDGTLVSAAVTGAAGYFEPISYHLTVPTPLPLVAGVGQVGMGDGFICAATAANVQCWGNNSSRQLGQGGASTVDILTPVPVMGLGPVNELEVGTQFACARTGGTVQCWGENGNSQTGEGVTTTDQSLPVTVMGLADATDIELGQDHACALRATGVVSCWGDDAVGQLGDDDGNTADSAVPVDVTGLPPGVAQIALGQDHGCALAGGEVYCWGEGGYGNLGQGTEIDSDTALVVPGLTGIVQIAAGYNYNCAVDGAGDMWCWGYSLDGHLGDGGQDLTGLGEVLSPTPFAVASGITSVVAGNSLTCIETIAGWSCVGFRSAGQLGNGTTVVPAVPTPTMFGP